jgi:hypothetical protein
MWGASRGGDCQCCDSSANSASNAAFPVPKNAADSGSDIYLFRNPQTHAPKPVVVKQTGTFGTKALTQDSFNAAYKNASWGADSVILGVECPSCTNKKLYYKRIRNPAALTNPFAQMFVTGPGNVFNVDYEQYKTSLADAIAGKNKLTALVSMSLSPYGSNVQCSFFDISPHA